MLKAASRAILLSCPSAPAVGFDFTGEMRRLCADMAARTSDLAHIDLARVAISFSQARKEVSWGLFASLTPLRFRGGERTTLRRGRRYAIQQILDEEGREMLYLLSFYLPRFMNLDHREKLITVFHELWHISPAFDGDIRRHNGRFYAHTHSQTRYDEQMGLLADRWLAATPDPAQWSFLLGDFRNLQARHGPVYGIRVPRPKLILASGFQACQTAGPKVEEK